MRPRVFPAEDVDMGRTVDVLDRASMRPRVFPAEDDQGGAEGGAQGQRFNEAAGIPRGRLADQPQLQRDDAGFNEAAGIPRGRQQPSQVAVLASVVPASMRPRVFPAEDAGMRADPHHRRRRASMRPRVFPAEDSRRSIFPMAFRTLQ